MGLTSVSARMGTKSSPKKNTLQNHHGKCVRLTIACATQISNKNWVLRIIQLCFLSAPVSFQMKLFTKGDFEQSYLINHKNANQKQCERQLRVRCSRGRFTSLFANPLHASCLGCNAMQCDVGHPIQDTVCLCVSPLYACFAYPFRALHSMSPLCAPPKCGGMGACWLRSVLPKREIAQQTYKKCKSPH